MPRKSVWITYISKEAQPRLGLFTLYNKTYFKTASEIAGFVRISMVSAGMLLETSLAAVFSGRLILTACRMAIDAISMTNTSPVRVFPFMCLLDLGLFQGSGFLLCFSSFAAPKITPHSHKRKIIPLYFLSKVEIRLFL